jgi:hypothetical protein
MPEAESVLSAEHTERRFKQRVLAQPSNPFIGDLDKATLDRVQAADQARTASGGLSPRASRAKRRPATPTDPSPRCLPAWDPPAADSQPETDSRNVPLVATTEFVSVERGFQFREARRSGWQ